VVGIVLSEVESLAAIVPLVSADASTAAMARAAAQTKKQPPLTASEFVKSYNATLTAKTGNANLDRVTAGLKIHLHGKAARWATAGVLE
jgi:putative salt-induced outer membrane protein YdiY